MDSEEEQNQVSLHQKLRELRSLTNSTAGNTTSILVDASRYIEELKKKVDKLNQDMGSSNSAEISSTHHHTPSSSFPAQVTVKAEEKGGLLIGVMSGGSCEGLLVLILEALEDVGLQVLDARVSCSHNFRLQARTQSDQGEAASMDAGVVQEAVVRAVCKWHESSRSHDSRPNSPTR